MFSLRAWTLNRCPRSAASFLKSAFTSTPRITYLYKRGGPTDYLEEKIRAMERREQNQARKKQGSDRLRGHPKEAPDIRISKTLSWVLRHGASSEGLYMRPDGYVRVKDLLAIPKMRGMHFMALERIVQEDEKMRYHLLCQPDTSDAPVSSGEDIWWIRANQGHTIKDVKLDLKEISDAGQVPMAVHGTSLKAWQSIADQGLSRMKRNHIHLAQGIDRGGVISGMRHSSQVLIFIDLGKALATGIKFYLSDNGVVLTEGDETGFLPPKFFRRVERMNRQPIPGWEGMEGRKSLTEGVESTRSSQAGPSNDDRQEPQNNM